MHDLIRDLEAGCRVLDLGAAGGSFAYDSTAADVVALDLDFPAVAQECQGRVLGDCRKLPFAAGVFDVVVCNHTLEHFEEPERSLSEIDRVVKPGGFLWVAVPDGFGFDDWLYRYLFEGGGHVNRFSLDSLVELVEEDSGLRATRYKPLHTGFVYLNPPDPAKLRYYPERAARLARVPPGLLCWGVRWLNWMVRFLDRWTGAALSLYGFGVVFESRGGKRLEAPVDALLKQIASDKNVCFSCGAGHPAESLQKFFKRHLLWRSYNCPLCGAWNLYTH